MLIATITSLSFPLKMSIQVNQVNIAIRNGYRIVLKDDSGWSGVGECIPLPGLHLETHLECLEQWENIQDQVQASKLNSSQFDLSKPYFGLLAVDREVHPSLEFAIEQALLTLYIRKNPATLKDVFNVRGCELSTSVNGLLILNQNSVDHVQEIASQVKLDGFQTLKIKVGRYSSQVEVDFLKRLNSCLEGSCQLRLDGNGLFNRENFFSFVNLLKDENIEYFEEPLPRSSIAFSREEYDDSPLSIALDESLPAYLEEIRAGIPLPKRVTAWVIKPTVIGGIHKTVNLIRLGRQLGIKCILSSTFDSGWTIATHALLAQLITAKAAMGLDTYKYLEKDPHQDQLNYSDGRLRIATDLFF
jgi:O-succinylbenzoate synthase